MNRYNEDLLFNDVQETPDKLGVSYAIDEMNKIEDNLEQIGTVKGGNPIEGEIDEDALFTPEVSVEPDVVQPLGMTPSQEYVEGQNLRQDYDTGGRVKGGLMDLQNQPELFTQHQAQLRDESQEVIENKQFFADNPLFGIPALDIEDEYIERDLPILDEYEYYNLDGTTVDVRPVDMMTNIMSNIGGNIASSANNFLAYKNGIDQIMETSGVDWDNDLEVSNMMKDYQLDEAEMMDYLRKSRAIQEEISKDDYYNRPVFRRNKVSGEIDKSTVGQSVANSKIPYKAMKRLTENGIPTGLEIGLVAGTGGLASPIVAGKHFADASGDAFADFQGKGYSVEESVGKATTAGLVEAGTEMIVDVALAGGLRNAVNGAKNGIGGGVKKLVHPITLAKEIGTGIMNPKATISGAKKVFSEGLKDALHKKGTNFFGTIATEEIEEIANHLTDRAVDRNLFSKEVNGELVYKDGTVIPSYEDGLGQVILETAITTGIFGNLGRRGGLAIRNKFAKAKMKTFRTKVKETIEKNSLMEDEDKAILSDVIDNASYEDLVDIVESIEPETETEEKIDGDLDVTANNDLVGEQQETEQKTEEAETKAKEISEPAVEATEDTQIEENGDEDVQVVVEDETKPVEDVKTDDTEPAKKIPITEKEFDDIDGEEIDGELLEDNGYENVEEFFDEKNDKYWVDNEGAVVGKDDKGRVEKFPTVDDFVRAKRDGFSETDENNIESKSFIAQHYPEHNLTEIMSKTDKDTPVMSYIGKRDKFFDKMRKAKTIGEVYNETNEEHELSDVFVRENPERYATDFNVMNWNKEKKIVGKKRDNLLSDVYKDIKNNEANELNPDGLKFMNIETSESDGKTLISTGRVLLGKLIVDGEGSKESVGKILTAIKDNLVARDSSVVSIKAIDKLIKGNELGKFVNKTELQQAMNTSKGYLNDFNSNNSEALIDKYVAKKKKDDDKPNKPSPKDKKEKFDEASQKIKDMINKTEKALKDKKKVTKEFIVDNLNTLASLPSDITNSMKAKVKVLFNKLKHLARNSGLGEAFNNFYLNPKNNMVMAVMGEDGQNNNGIGDKKETWFDKKNKVYGQTTKNLESAKEAKTKLAENVKNVEKKSKKAKKLITKLARVDSDNVIGVDTKQLVKDMTNNLQNPELKLKKDDRYDKFKEMISKELKDKASEKMESDIEILKKGFTKTNRGKLGKISRALLSTDGILRILGEDYNRVFGGKMLDANNTFTKLFTNNQMKMKTDIDAMKVKKPLKSKFKTIDGNDISMDEAMNMFVTDPTRIAEENTNNDTITFETSDDDNLKVVTEMSIEDYVKNRKEFFDKIANDETLKEFLVYSVEKTNEMKKQFNDYLTINNLMVNPNEKEKNDFFKVSELKGTTDEKLDQIRLEGLELPLSIIKDYDTGFADILDPARQNSLINNFMGEYKVDKPNEKDKLIRKYKVYKTGDKLYDFNKKVSSIIAYNRTAIEISNLMSDEDVKKNITYKIGKDGYTSLYEGLQDIILDNTELIKNKKKQVGEGLVRGATALFYPLALGYNIKVAVGQIASFPLATISKDLVDPNAPLLKRKGKQYIINPLKSSAYLAKNIGKRVIPRQYDIRKDWMKTDTFRNHFYENVLPALRERDLGFTQTLESKEFLKKSIKDEDLSLLGNIAHYATAPGRAISRFGMSGISMMDMATIDTIVDMYMDVYANKFNNQLAQDIKVQMDIMDNEKSTPEQYDKANKELERIMAEDDTEALLKQMSDSIVKNINRSQPTADKMYVQSIRNLHPSLKFITMFLTQPLQNVENLTVDVRKVMNEPKVKSNWEDLGETVFKILVSMGLFTLVGKLMNENYDDLVHEEEFTETMAKNLLSSIPVASEILEMFEGDYMGSGKESNTPLIKAIRDGVKFVYLVNKLSDDEYTKAKRNMRKDKRDWIIDEEANPLEKAQNFLKSDEGQMLDLMIQYGLQFDPKKVIKSAKQVSDIKLETAFDKAMKMDKLNKKGISSKFREEGDLKGLKAYRNALRYGKSLKNAELEAQGYMTE